MKVKMFWQNLKSMKHIQQEELTKTLLDINAPGEVAVGLSWAVFHYAGLSFRASRPAEARAHLYYVQASHLQCII